MNKIQNSLSKKILFMVVTSFLFINIFLHGGVAFLNKQTFYKLEGEKADIIVKNYAPLIAVGLYLGMDNRVEKLLDQILNNDSVLQAEVYQNSKLVAKAANEDKTDGIIISTPIFKPNTQTKFGKLKIVYSTKRFEALMRYYAILMTFAMIAVIAVVFWLNMYIQKLLKPLRKLASMLRDYSPKTDMQIPYLDEKNEIGLISNALNISHKKTQEYEASLHQLNKTLENKIREKTKRLEKHLFTEPITKLPNRLSLLNDLKECKKDAILAILCLDNFREINSFYGYDIGDKLLKLVRDRIKTIFSSSDYTLYKLPSREFVLFSEKAESEVIFSAILLELTNILNKNPFFIDDYEIHVTFTIGASINESSLLAKADIALQEAYKLKQPVVLYNRTHQIEKQIDKNIQMIKKIKSAIKVDG